MGDHLGDREWLRALLGGPATDLIPLSLNENLREPIPSIEKATADSARDVGVCPAPLRWRKVPRSHAHFHWSPGCGEPLVTFLAERRVLARRKLIKAEVGRSV